jgi:glucan phosphorylase
MSTLDGWWAEGFNGHNGWTIATPAIEGDDPDTLANAAGQLYTLLETEAVPAFYDRNGDGLPRRWIAMMKHALRAAGNSFTARRMVSEYVTRFYLPAMRGDPLPDVPPRA